MDATDLPDPVATALVRPAEGIRRTVEAAGIPWSAVTWGDPADRPVLLIHGVTSSSATWWRVGPAIAAAGRHVTAIDLPGHGRTGNWRGHTPFRDTAADVAAFIRAAGLDEAGLGVVGHSWGAMIAAAMPAAGLRPAILVLLDPPILPFAEIAALVADPESRTYDDLDEARRLIAAGNPGWAAGDIEAKAEALTQLDEAAALGVLGENGDWDGGLADLRDPAVAGIELWVIRGDPRAGAYVPDHAVADYEALAGPGHVITMEDGPHSPQRTHPVETTAALLRALGG